ncbi:Down syndrome critical region protein 3 [Aphanomyces cochlioides]|nr:Down syndrome critical region protein 3 [Aphanomyces cochlioides]
MDSAGDDADYNDDFLPDEHEDTAESSVADSPLKEESPSKRQAAINEHHRHALAAKESQVRSLYKKIGLYRKANAALRRELESFHNNDVVAQLENKAREKELLIEKLTHENKCLANLQRTQAKRIEELESLKEHFPSKHHSVLEELRICKETYRLYKERERQAEERSAKLHEQVVDLSIKNKQLADKIRQHELAKAAAPATATEEDGKDELEQLQQRIHMLEKNKRAEKAKYERVIQTCQDQLDACKQEMERFQAQLLEKEKALRLQVIELKKLKRQLRELVLESETTQQVSHFLTQRGVDVKVPAPPPPSQDKRSAAPPRQPKRMQSSD